MQEVFHSAPPNWTGNRSYRSSFPFLRWSYRCSCPIYLAKNSADNVTARKLGMRGPSKDKTVPQLSSLRQLDLFLNAALPEDEFLRTRDKRFA